MRRPNMSNNNIDEKLIRDHEYDGIRELDNPLPGWWLATFYGTIIFAFLYYIHYTFTDAPNLKQEFEMAMEQLKSIKVATTTLPSEDELVAKFNGSSQVSGKAIFISKCASCHGEKGAGLIGPNLTDNAWIHGKGTRSDIYKTISEGVLDKGMPAWAEMLKSDELSDVTSFVFSIKGMFAPGGKPPQGSESK